MNSSKKKVPAQEQSLPGSEQDMDPKPVSDDPEYKATGKLKDKVAWHSFYCTVPWDG